MGLLHSAVGFGAIGLGATVRLGKGTRRHVWAGRAYVAAMIGLN